jgi:PhnB protein
MAKSKQPIPEGLRAITPQLVVDDAHKLLAFLKKAFGASGEQMMPGPDGKTVMHGFARIGDCAVFFSDAPGFAKPTRANLFLYVPDADSVYRQATAAGAKPVVPLADMFWGDRWGMVEDPFGNVWQIATHIEDLTPVEMVQRAAAAAAPR